MAEQAILGDAALSGAGSSVALGQAQQVEALVAQHMRMVFRICWSILRNHHDAEDAVQECFLRVLKFQDRIHQIRNPKTWLARIAWTTALDKRSGKPFQEESSGKRDLLEEDVLERLPDPALPLEQLVAGRELQGILERLIGTLPDELREPIELSAVQELNSTEIAEIMKIPAESVRTRLFRARQLLKTKLAVLLEVQKHG
jgi:RNA polymerase sigma-70 factor (ECF subfamily)